LLAAEACRAGKRSRAQIAVAEDPAEAELAHHRQPRRPHVTPPFRRSFTRTHPPARTTNNRKVSGTRLKRATCESLLEKERTMDGTQPLAPTEGMLESKPDARLRRAAARARAAMRLGIGGRFDALQKGRRGLRERLDLVLERLAAVPPRALVAAR